MIQSSLIKVMPKEKDLPYETRERMSLETDKSRVRTFPYYCTYERNRVAASSAGQEEETERKRDEGNRERNEIEETNISGAEK